MVGFLLGLVVGLVPLLLPNRILYRADVQTMDGATFAETQPDRAEIRWVFPVLYFVTVLVLYFALTPWHRQALIEDASFTVNFLFTYALFAGSAILTGLFELVTEVSPMYGGRTLVSFQFIVGDPVRRAGVLRIVVSLLILAGVYALHVAMG